MVKELEIIAETVKHFVQNVISPPLEEIGGLLADQIKSYRFRNQVTIISKAEEHLKKKGIKTKKVSLKILAPMLEECSLEEDESLQEMWANLIANTVKEGSNISNPLFTRILSDLSKDEAILLEAMIEESLERVPIEERTTFRTHLINYKQFEKDKKYRLMIDNLLRLRLIAEPYGQKSTMPVLEVTDLGYSFFEACQPPQ